MYGVPTLLIFGAIAWHLTFGVIFVAYSMFRGILNNTDWKEKLLLLSMVVIWPTYVFFTIDENSSKW